MFLTKVYKKGDLQRFWFRDPIFIYWAEVAFKYTLLLIYSRAPYNVYKH